MAGGGCSAPGCKILSSDAERLLLARGSWLLYRLEVRAEDLTMAADAGKPSKRKPLKARPRPDVDREKLRADISERFSETLEYLAK